MSRVPSLNWLRVFEAAARTESFARAASQLNLSAAAVSQQIRALEDKLGAPLFERGAQSVTLTDLGRSYLPTVQQSLGLLEEATEGIFGSGAEQPLFVRSVLLFAHGVLAGGVRDFQTAHPGVRLTLNTGNAASDFDGGYSDLQIVFGTPGQFGRDYDPLMGETLYPAATPALAAQINAPADLSRHPLIEVATHRSGWRHVMHALGQPLAPLRIVHADSTVMAAAMAAQGVGVMLARASASDLVVAQSGLVRCAGHVEIPGTDQYFLVCADRSALRPAARAFRGWLLDYMKRDGGTPPAT
ncbi:LysR substrate-binding domain-containing protein [uncultured Roseobacter sp.]|uniref:LysR substrate-binding domain-containing protein n=1 Tax=uncultured Roseobacter sp. TaxID=114847 RepID=UPI00263389FA|nr:LysR substrate-binding domain-containing protein [uncultured Roseobacter sp.]